MAPFSPQIRTFAVLSLNQAVSEFVGRRAGDEGLTALESWPIRRLSLIRGSLVSVAIETPLAPHPQTPSPREFGSRLMKLQSVFVRILEERGLSGMVFY